MKFLILFLSLFIFSTSAYAAPKDAQPSVQELQKRIAEMSGILGAMNAQLRLRNVRPYGTTFQTAKQINCNDHKVVRDFLLGEGYIYIGYGFINDAMGMVGASNVLYGHPKEQKLIMVRSVTQGREVLSCISDSIPNFAFSSKFLNLFNDGSRAAH